MASNPGKRYREQEKKANKEPLPVDEGIKRVKELASGTKFDQSIEAVVHLGIDPRQADQAIRGSIALPHGIGKTKRVIAFCQGENVEKAQAAGAIEAGGDELVKKIQDGWTDFDVAVASPDMMPKVGRLGKVLGPQGKMPSPKTGTVTNEVEKAVKEYSAGKIEFRNDDGGNIHVVIGKASFPEDNLKENFEVLLNQLKRMKPAAAKGTYILKVVLSGSMSPPVPVAVS
jgi:large subunit ribosomal protein L1